MQSDPLGDFLTQIRNANCVGQAEIATPYSTIKGNIADVLKREGYVKDFALEKRNDKQTLMVYFKCSSKERTIQGIKRVSKPGLRRYVGVKDIPRVLGGMGVAILSTPKGVLSGQEAKKQNVGGEILAYVW